jgi:hypothetical protein
MSGQPGTVRKRQPVQPIHHVHHTCRVTLLQPAIGLIGCYTRLPPPPSPPTSRFRNNLCKDDSALFSRFLHVFNLLYVSNKANLTTNLVWSVVTLLILLPCKKPYSIRLHPKWHSVILQYCKNILSAIVLKKTQKHYNIFTKTVGLIRLALMEL